MSVDQTEIENYRKTFGFTEVFWQIENYLAVACKRNWLLQSSEFSIRGPVETRWRISMNSKYVDEEYYVELCLQRLHCDSYDKELMVEWNWSCSYGSTGHYVISYKKGLFWNNTKRCSLIHDIDMIEEKLISSTYRLFTVECKMIVYDKDNYNHDKCRDLGLKELSQNMRVLYRTNINSDVLLGAKEYKIRAHKAIIRARNSVLRDELGDKDSADLRNSDMINANDGINFIGFLYTANLDFVLRTPSFHMNDLINYYEVHELKGYYLKDEVFLSTYNDSEIVVYVWSIDGADGAGRNCIKSSVWNIEDLNLKLQACLYKRGLHGISNTMSLFIGFVDGEVPNEMFFACAVETASKSEWQYQRWKSNTGTKLGFQFFAPSQNFDDCFANGKAKIVCRFILPNDIPPRSTVVKVKNSSFTRLKNDQHYERFSADIESLFSTMELSDIKVSTGSLSFNVHRPILYCRSHKFHDLLQNLGHGNELTLGNVNPDVLRIILRYIYSGILRYATPELYQGIYSTANTFGLTRLKYDCSKLMREDLKSSNALETLRFAGDSKDLKLKEAAAEFICSNLQEVIESAEWQSFKADFPGLQKFIIDRAEKYIGGIQWIKYFRIF